jgi:hypothetical protein
MLKIRPRPQQFFILFFASLLFGCATPHPKFDATALKPYQKLMLVPIKTDEMLFVTQRLRYTQPTAGSALGDVYAGWVMQLNQDFNKQIKRDMKPELEAQLYAAINKSFIANRVKYTPFEMSAKEIFTSRYSDELKPDYLTTLRQKCPTCDAALLIDPSFGFVQKGDAGWRAVSNADLLLLNLMDGTIRAKSSASFMDETSKYEYRVDIELLKDAPGAARHIPPTVDGLAKVMFSSTQLVAR